MHRKKIILPIISILVLMVSLCWAAPPFNLLLNNMKDHAYTAREEGKNSEQLANRIYQLAIEIDDLSHGANLKQQKNKLQRLKEKTDQFQKWVLELDKKTDILTELAAKLQNESRMLFEASHIGPGAPAIDKCGPGKIWIPGHIAPNGKRVKGYCAPQ